MPSYIDWKIQSEVDRAEVEDALLGIKLMYQFGKQLGMPDPEERIVVYIDNDLERLASYYSELTGWDLELSRKSWEGGGAEAGQGWIMAMVSPPGETFWEPGGLVEPMAHELVHASFQTGVAGLLTDPAAFQGHGSVSSPRWLTEGMAILLSELALAEHRGTDHSQKRKGWVLQAEAIDLPLRDAETWPSGWAGSVGPDDELDEGRVVINCIYKCGYVAVELLASRVGLRKLSDYYMYLETRMLPRRVSEKDYPRPGWRVAFERAFGMPVEEFYVLFEEHRAAGFPDPNRPTPTGPQAVDDYIVWKVGDEVSPTAEAETRETVLAVHDYAVGIGMPRIDRPIFIFLYHNLDSLAAAFEANTGEPTTESWYWPEFSQGKLTILAGRDWIAVTTSATRYQEWSPDTRKRELAGNLFDVYRRALTGIWQGTPRDAVDPEGPQWLRAGSREYLTYQVLRAPGPESCNLTRRRYARISESVDTPLSEAETSEDFWALGNSYAHGFLAVELLAEQAGPESIMGYFASLRTGVTWHEAFESAFGMTVEEFYQLFDERSAAGFTRPRCPLLPPLVTLPGSPEPTATPTPTPTPASAPTATPTPTPAPTATPTPTPIPKQDILDYVRWEIGSEVSLADEQNARYAVQLMHDYAVSLGMPEIKEDITFYLYHNHDALFAAYARVGGVSVDYARDHWEDGDAIGETGPEAWGAWVFVNTSAPWFREDPVNLMSTSAGEFVGALTTYTLSEFSWRSGTGEVPRWLDAGIHTILQIRALEEGGLISYDTKRNSLVESAKYVGKQPLSEMETWRGFSGIRGDAYDYSTMAGELLASLAGESSLIKYYANLKVGTTWQKEFQKSFGMTVDKFYELFEEHRAAGFPDPLTPTPTGAQAVDDYIVWKVGDEVSSTAEAEARETVLAVHDYAVDLGLSRLGSPITIFLHRNLDALAAEFEATTGRELENRGGPDFAAGRNPFANGSNWVAVNTSAVRYQEWTPETRERQLGGHFSDALLQEMSGLRLRAPADRVPPGGPAWLREGSERYITYQALRSTVPESCDPTRSRYARISESEDTPLSEAETSEDFWALGNSYAHGFLAVELLAEQADPEAVIAYFAALQPGSNWQETFHAAFGITIEEFYQRFEERRAAGFPRPRCPTLPPLVTLPGSPEYVKWEIEDEVPDEYVQNAVVGVKIMHDYIVSLGMPSSYEDITIYLYHTLDGMISAYARGTGASLADSRSVWNPPNGAVGVGGQGGFYIWAGHPLHSRRPMVNFVRHVAGELIHSLQADLNYPLFATAPRWLTSGSAYVLDCQALAKAGLKTDRCQREKFISDVGQMDTPLMYMETWTDFSQSGQAPYPYSALAAELLANHAGHAVLMRFFHPQEPGTTWREAFQIAFGMTVEEFYIMFEEHRAAGFPELDVSK